MLSLHFKFPYSQHLSAILSYDFLSSVSILQKPNDEYQAKTLQMLRFYAAGE